MEIGKQYHDLTVIGLSEEKGKRKIYECECICGSKVNVLVYYLKSGHTKSCGCRRRRHSKESASWGGFGEISRRHWSDIENKAKSRKIPLHITIKDAWSKFQEQDRKCALTGLPISLLSRKGQYTEKTASLDRIDSSLPYTKENIQWVHKEVNIMKNQLSEERLVELCQLIISQRTQQ